jgi:hypothetical protein
MSDLTLNISNLKAKVEKLVILHKQLKKENERLVAEMETSAKTIKEQKNTIEALQKNNKELLQNKQEGQNKIITDTKLKINELVQEIDQCIALLK